MLWRRLKYFSAFTVIRPELLFAVLVALMCYSMLNSQYGLGTSDGEATLQWNTILIFVQLLLIAICLLCGFSIVTAIFSWLWFLIRVRRRALPVVRFGAGEQAQAGIVPVYLEVKQILRPLLGAVRGRLIFSNYTQSEVVSLDDAVRKKGEWLRSGLSGEAPTWLWDRGAYDVEEVQFQFVDMLRLIALPVSFPIRSRLWTAAPVSEVLNTTIFPNKTIEQTERTDTPKKVEGEYINYKDFEPGDDVRRIVWKVYARNRQLIVRIPETRDPYASHVYLYASFYSGTTDLAASMFGNELLNHYKDEVRRVHDSLSASGWSVRFPFDQEVPQDVDVPKENLALFRISNAVWQSDQRPAEYVNPADAAFICLSGLIPQAEVEALLQIVPAHVPIALIQLSESIPFPIRWHWKNLLVRPRKTPVDGLRTPWFISPMRQRLQKNEAALALLLQRRGNATTITASSNIHTVLNEQAS